MNLQIIGGEYHGFVEDRLGKELVNEVVSRRAYWSPEQSALVEDTLKTSIITNESHQDVLLRFTRCNTAGRMFYEFAMELGESTSAHGSNDVIGRTIHNWIWSKMFDGNVIAQAAVREYIAARGVSIESITVSEGDNAANNGGLLHGI